MTNLIDELYDVLNLNNKSVSDILAINIVNTHYTNDDDIDVLISKVGESENSIIAKFSELKNYNYDSGFGSAYFDGSVVWFKDGSWLERWEYDGSEGWSYKETPVIPYNLRGGDSD